MKYNKPPEMPKLGEITGESEEGLNKCPHCKEGILEIIPADEPYNDEHLQCSVCCSTYDIKAFKEITEGDSE